MTDRRHFAAFIAAAAMLPSALSPLMAGLGLAVAIGVMSLFGALAPDAQIATAQSGNIDDYIDSARATQTPTPTPTIGDPISDGLLWIYIRVPENKAAEMEESGCEVRDDALDQAIWKNDPFVIADEHGSILLKDGFMGSTRIRSDQTPWQPGTNDEGWTADDGTRWCRFQGRLGFLPYSPLYQIVFGDKARGPYTVSWESVIRDDNKMIFGVDLTGASDASVASTPIAVVSRPADVTPVTVRTDPVQLTGPPVTISADYIAGLGPFSVVAITNDGRRIPVFDESSDFAGFANIPDLKGAQTISFEVTAAGLWTLVAW